MLRQKVSENLAFSFQGEELAPEWVFLGHKFECRWPENTWLP